MDLHLAHALHFYPQRMSEMYPNISNLSDLEEQVDALYANLSNPQLQAIRQEAKAQYYRMLYQHFPENYSDH